MGFRSKKSQTLFIFIFILIIFSFMIFFTPDLNRLDLELKYAGSPSQFTEVDGLRVHYRDTGDRSAKQTVVLLHGFGSSLQTWDEWASDLEKNRRVIRLDLAGFGLTGASPDNNYSDDADVARLFKFLEKINVQKCILVGHSMGGRIAWNFASSYPERLEGLALLAPDGFPAPGQIVGAKPYDAGPLANLLKFFMPKFIIKKSLEPAFFDSSFMTDILLDRYYDMLRAPTVRTAILQRMSQTITVDPVPKLRKINIPTLLLWGERDQMIPASNSQDYSRVMPNAKVIILQRASHLLQEENAQASLASFKEFLSSSIK